MDSKTRVSVVIGFLNAEKFIQETIESVLAQTYEHWELLLVDDGSTDGSTAIAQRYAEKYPRKIRYLEHEGHQNRGVCVSRNLGIRHSQADFIAILDADDVWLPHKLEQQVAILDAHPEAAMVYGASQYWHSWTGKTEDAGRDFIPELGVPLDTLFQPPTLVTLCYPLGKGSAPCPSDLLLRREIVERIGGFEEDFRGMYQLYEDQAFLVKVYLSAPVFVANACWERYRLHPDSCMGKVKQYQTIRLFFLKWLEEYLIQQEVKDSKIWKAFHKALFPYQKPHLYRLLRLPQKLVEYIKGLVKQAEVTG